MTKIVYNACFGGFGLSHAAIKQYGEIKGMNLVFVKDTEFARKFDDLDEDSAFNFGSWYVDGIQDDDHRFSAYDLEEDRTDPALVQVVEELGDAASGQFSRLLIAELPKGTKYRIDEYDGNESVMTNDDYDWRVA